MKNKSSLSQEVQKNICSYYFDRYKCRGICKSVNDYVIKKRGEKKE